MGSPPLPITYLEDPQFLIALLVDNGDVSHIPMVGGLYLTMTELLDLTSLCLVVQYVSCLCSLSVPREQGGRGDDDAGMVHSPQRQERAHQETD